MNHITREAVIQAIEAQDTWEEAIIAEIVVDTVDLIADVGHQEEEEVDSTINLILGNSRITTLRTLNLNAMKRLEKKTRLNMRRTHSNSAVS